MYEKNYSLLKELYPENDIDSYNKRIHTLLNFMRRGGYITAELNKDGKQITCYKTCKIKFDRRIFNKDYDIHKFTGFIIIPKFKYSDLQISDDKTENYFNKITLKMWDPNDITKPVILYSQEFPNEYFDTNKRFTILINLCKLEIIKEEKENKKMNRNYYEQLCKSPLLKNPSLSEDLSNNKICNTCIKSDVCIYRTLMNEAVDKIKNDSTGIDFLDVKITCKKWHRDEPSIK